MCIIQIGICAQHRLPCRDARPKRDTPVRGIRYGQLRQLAHCHDTHAVGTCTRVLIRTDWRTSHGECLDSAKAGAWSGAVQFHGSGIHGYTPDWFLSLAVTGRHRQASVLGKSLAAVQMAGCAHAYAGHTYAYSRDTTCQGLTP